MTTFGQLKTYIENKLIESYNTNSFKEELNFFKKNILENNTISKIYNGYDELSKPKNLSSDISTEYIQESVMLIQKLLKQKETLIEDICSKIDIKKYDNNYQDIDNMMYLTDQNQILERIESKNKIKKLLESTQVNDTKEHIDIPLSSMSTIAAKTIDKNYSNISDYDLKTLKEYFSLDNKEIMSEIEDCKKTILSKLDEKKTSSDSDLNETIDKTITKVKNTEYNLHSLYQLRELLIGL